MVMAHQMTLHQKLAVDIIHLVKREQRRFSEQGNLPDRGTDSPQDFIQDLLVGPVCKRKRHQIPGQTNARRKNNIGARACSAQPFSRMRNQIIKFHVSSILFQLADPIPQLDSLFKIFVANGFLQTPPQNFQLIRLLARNRTGSWPGGWPGVRKLTGNGH